MDMATAVSNSFWIYSLKITHFLLSIAINFIQEKKTEQEKKRIHEGTRVKYPERKTQNTIRRIQPGNPIHRSLQIIHCSNHNANKTIFWSTLKQIRIIIAYFYTMYRWLVTNKRWYCIMDANTLSQQKTKEEQNRPQSRCIAYYIEAHSMMLLEIYFTTCMYILWI